MQLTPLWVALGRIGGNNGDDKLYYTGRCKFDTTS
jgi:hypothetical protein